MTAVLAEEIMLDTSRMNWINFADGIDYKILRTSAESGLWSVIFRCAKGACFAPHLHYGAGEHFVLKGAMDYRMGSAKTGDYGYEPLGVFHDETSFPEYTELLFTNHGPIAFTNPDGSVKMLLDWKFFADQQTAAQKDAAQRKTSD